MKQGRSLACLAPLVSCLAAATTNAATINFDSFPPGYVFGSPVDDEPGDVVHTEEGIRMSLERFYFGQFTGFYEAEIGGRYSEGSLELNNISVLFDFTNIGFDVDLVTVEFQEFGGMQNFAVNGGTIYELASLSDVPYKPVPNVTAVTDNDVLTVTGDIFSVRIGGQELVIESLVAFPEPATAILVCVGGLALSMRRKRYGR